MGWDDCGKKFNGFCLSVLWLPNRGEQAICAFVSYQRTKCLARINAIDSRAAAQ